MDNLKYNAMGVAEPQPLGSKSPASNPGVVYQPANQPTNPGALKVAPQAVRNIIYKAQDGGATNVGTQSDSPAVVNIDGVNIGGAAGILIYDKDYKTAAPLFATWNSAITYAKGDLVGFGHFNYVALKSSSNKQPDTNPTFWMTTSPIGLPSVILLETFASPTALTIQNRPDAASPITLAAITNNSSEAADALTLTGLNVVSTHFTQIATLVGADTGSGPGFTTFWMSDGASPNGALSGNTGDICFNGPNGALFYCISGTNWAQAVTSGGAISGQYASAEFDNGNVATTATINWNNGNVQYATMTADTTFTFSNPLSGGRYVLELAGAHTPTLPGAVRWSGGITPTPTATAGKKDIYNFVYSAKETLYDGIQSANFATT